MKDSLTHAILVTGLLERDLARISASGNEAQQGLAADCAEHRRQLANKLRHIDHLSQMESLISETNSEESRDRYEASAKAGDFNGHVTAGEYTLRVGNDHAPDGYFAGHPIGEYREHAYDDSDINETTDDEYMRHAAVSDAKALADYQRRVRNLGWVMAAIALGAIIAIVEIVATICG